MSQETPVDETENASEHVKKLAMIFDILIISAQSAGGAKQVFKSLLEVLQLEGELLQKSQKKEPLLLSKQRSKLMEHLLLVRASQCISFMILFSHSLLLLSWFSRKNIVKLAVVSEWQIYDLFLFLEIF